MQVLSMNTSDTLRADTPDVPSPTRASELTSHARDVIGLKTATLGYGQSGKAWTTFLVQPYLQNPRYFKVHMNFR